MHLKINEINFVMLMYIVFLFQCGHREHSRIPVTAHEGHRETGYSPRIPQTAAASARRRKEETQQNQEEAFVL